MTTDRLEAFWSRVDKREDGCWIWTAARTGGGYGVCYTPQHQQVRAHRAAYELLRDEIPAGLDLDHLCRNRACVNPDHLEPVTRQENLLRSPITLAAKKAAQTHCVHGHEFTPENTRIRRGDGTRHCKTCHREQDLKRWHARRKKAVV